MGLLGLSAMEWFVVLDLFVLMGSTVLAATLFRKLKAKQALIAPLRADD